MLSETQIAAYATYFILKVSDKKIKQFFAKKGLVPNYAKR